MILLFVKILSFILPHSMYLHMHMCSRKKESLCKKYDLLAYFVTKIRLGKSHITGYLYVIQMSVFINYCNSIMSFPNLCTRILLVVNNLNNASCLKYFSVIKNTHNIFEFKKCGFIVHLEGYRYQLSRCYLSLITHA